jgi:hypothetical protein
MQELHFDVAPWFRALYLGFATILVSAGAAISIETDDRSGRWLSLLVLGGAGVLCAWFAVTSRRRLTLENQGIHGRPFGVVLWGDIEDAFVRWNNLNRVLGLKVRQPSRYLGRLPPWRRSLWRLSQRADFGDVSFDITGMRIGSEEVVRLVRERAGCEPSDS